MEILVSIAFAASGLALLCYGGNWLVDGGIAIAKRFQISPLIIGMTVVAYGTSTPELAASLAAGPHGSLVLGNIIGSNIANIGMVIGIAAILTPLAIKRKQIRVIVPIMIGFFSCLRDGIFVCKYGKRNEKSNQNYAIICIKFSIKGEDYKQE